MADKKLTKDQIIDNLQYALALMAQDHQALEAENAELSRMSKKYYQDLLDALEDVERLEAHQGSNAKKLLDGDVRMIRNTYLRGIHSQREIAEMYGVNPATVSRIVRKQYHSDVR